MSHTTTVKSVQIKSVSALKQMAKNLVQKGLNVELLQNSVPRMYYRDQIARTLKAQGKKMQYHANVEECDYVLRVKDAFYDIGFLKDDEGNYVPLFDDFSFPSPHLVGHPDVGTKPLKALVGTAAPIGTPVAEAVSYSIGKVMQEYSLCAATEACLEAGYSILGTSFDNAGQVILEVEVL